MRHLKKIWLALVLLVSIHVSFCQPGNVNYYKTRQRYYLLMTDSLNGIPSDTFNLHTPYAINNTWNLYPWIASKGDITYLWSVVQQRWIATNIPLISTVSVINDSTIQICNNNGCDTVNFNITTNVITNVSIISDSTLLVCVNNSCDTVTFNITQPPVQTVSILNDSTIIVCDANGCDTLHINSPPGITNVSIINDSTIQVCNINSCDTIIFSSPPTVTILNDSTIQVCNATGSCDTIIISSPVDITIINDSTIQVCGSNIDGPELITNGDFNGSATGWELGALWNYGSGNIVHSFGSTQATAQAGGLVQGGSYRVTADIGGSTGTVDVKLDAGTSQTYAGGAGTITFTGTWNNGNNYKIVFLPSTDFDGTITNVSVKQILPNCDTIQIQPAFFLDTIHIFVESPLHARNDSTFYITRASKLDSGFLSDSDFTYFWHKVDSIYTHPSPGGVDSFFYKNGDTTVLWYLNDVVADGIVSGGQVVFSGTPLVYNVTPAVYRINGVRYTSPGTQLTINNFDLSYPRTDVFYVDTSSNAGYLPGIAATPNLKPSINRAWQLELTSIDFPAGGLPGLDTVIVFDQNIAAPTEWTPITSGGTTINANDLSSPWRGTKDLDVTNINNASFISFNYGTTFDLSPFQSLNGFIKLKTPLPSTSTIRLVWQTSGSTVSQMRIIPLNGSNTTTYQAFSLPLNNFGLSSNIVTNLRLQYVNTSGNNFYLGFLMDYVYLQSGLAPTPQGANALVRVSRAAGKDSVMGTYQDGSISYQFKDSAGAAPVTITADNGLTDSVNRIILGGTLYKTTTINASGFQLAVTGTFSPTFNVTNTSTGSAIRGVASTGTGVLGSTTSSGTGVSGSSTTGTGVLGNGASFGVHGTTNTGIGVKANSNSGLPLYVTTNNPSVGTGIDTAIEVHRPTSNGVASNGIGYSLDLYLGSTTSENISNQIITKWTDATTATRTSQFSITGVNNAVTADLFTLSGSGSTRLNKYGIGTFTGTPATYAAWDASGNMIEVSGSGIGGLITANNGLTDSVNRIILGGTLYKTTTIDAASFSLIIPGTINGNVLDVSNSNNNNVPAIKGTSTGTSGTGVWGSATQNGAGVTGTSVNGVGLLGTSTANYALSAIGLLGSNIGANNVSTNTATEISTFYRNVASGVGANGVGGIINISIEDDGGNPALANQFISKFTDATHATRTSQLDITGVNSAATNTIMSAYGSGVVGIGISSSYTATRLNVVDNAVAGTPMVNLTSTSTVATGGVQTLLNISLTGANANAGERTYGEYVSNTHTGTTPLNTGIYGEASGGTATRGIHGVNLGTGAGVRGDGSWGVYGTSSVVAAFYGIANTTANGIYAEATDAVTGHFLRNPSSTNTVVPVLQISRATQGTAANGIGGSIDLYSYTDNGSNGLANQLISKWTTAANATRTSQFSLTGVNSAVTNDIIYFEGDKRTRFNGRAEFLMGANVTAANDLTLGGDGNVFTITGNTQINAISTANWQSGSEIILIFTGTPTVKNNTAGGAGTAPFLLAGGSDFSATANDVLRVVWNGTNFIEESRSVN